MCTVGRSDSNVVFSLRCFAVALHTLHVGSVRTSGCFELHPDKLMKSKCQGMRLRGSEPNVTAAQANPAYHLLINAGRREDDP